jgi:hypothetical protein
MRIQKLLQAVFRSFERQSIKEIRKTLEERLIRRGVYNISVPRALVNRAFQISAKRNSYAIQLSYKQIPGFFHVGQIRNPHYEDELVEYDLSVDEYHTAFYHWEHDEMINQPEYPDSPLKHWDVYARIEEIA